MVPPLCSLEGCLEDSFLNFFVDNRHAANERDGNDVAVISVEQVPRFQRYGPEKTRRLREKRGRVTKEAADISAPPMSTIPTVSATTGTAISAAVTVRGARGGWCYLGRSSHSCR